MFNVWIVVVKRNKRIFGGKVEKAKRRGRAKTRRSKKEWGKKEKHKSISKNTHKNTKGTTHFG